MMKKIAVVLSVALAFSQFVPKSSAQAAMAVGSSRAIAVTWDGSQGAWHQIRRIKPTVEMLSLTPFEGNSWIDTSPAPGTNTYEIEALDSGLNHVASVQASAQTEPLKPTLSMPCNTIVSFSIGSKTFTHDGVNKEMSAAPMLKDGKSYLVIRYIVEPLGGTLGFDKASGKVTIAALEHTIEMWLGKPVAKVDGIEKPIDPKNPKVAPFVSGGRTYVPLRFPVESLGRGAIDWFASTKTAVLTFPLGCMDSVEGEITHANTDSFSIDGKEIPLPPNTKAVVGKCVSAKTETVSGKVFTGSVLVTPCAPCEGDQFSGKVISSADTLMIKDVYGNVRTFRKGVVAFSPAPGTCVSGCSAGDTLVSLRLSECPLQTFEGRVLTLCRDGFFSASIGGASYQIRIPAGFDCSRLIVDSCVRVEGTPDQASPNTVNASRIEAAPCEVGKEYIVYTQGSCTGRAVPVADISGNAYNLTVPQDSVCDFQGGACLKVTAIVSGASMTASKLQAIQPPKDPTVYHRAVVTSENPLQMTIPGGRTYSLIQPPYFRSKLGKGAFIEVWGTPKSDALPAVRMVVIPGATKTVSGRIVEVFCDTGSIALKSGQNRISLKLPLEFDCKSLVAGDCVKSLGIFEGSGFLGASIEKVPCESGCTGKTIRGVVVSVDCNALTFRIKSDEPSYYNVSLTPGMNCGQLYRGVCVAVCGEITGDRIDAQTINLTDCPRDVCSGKIFEGIIQSVDCGANSAILATKDGPKTFALPETTECSRLTPGQCAEVCISGDAATYIKVQNCTAFGTVIEGTVISEGTVELSDGKQLAIRTTARLNVGDCVVATGSMSDMESDTFIARIVAVVPCANSSGFAGRIESIDCKARRIAVMSATGPKEAELPEGFNCSGFKPGDCVFVKVGPAVTVNKITCPDYERMHSAIYITSTSQDSFTGTDLSSLSVVKVIGSYSVSRGQTVVANGHRIDSGTMEGAFIEPVTRGMSQPKAETLRFNSFDKATGIAGFEEADGTMKLVIVDPESVKGAKPGDVFNLKTTVWDTSFGPRAEVATDLASTTPETFAKQTVVGVIFAIDTVDEMILVHTHEGDNKAVAPADIAVLSSVRIGDCVIATGMADKAKSVIVGAKLDVSDCAGGEIGRSFTGIITGIDGIRGTIQIGSDNGGTFEVYTEAVSQLTGLSIGDCVAVSGIILSRSRPNFILGKLIQRIDCKNPSNQPVTVEGVTEDYSPGTKQLRFKSQFGGTWTAFVEMVDVPPLSRGVSVRVSGRMQAKTFTISKAYVTAIELPPSRWSVSGRVTEKSEKSFKLVDSSGRNWILHSESVPETETAILAAGIVPTFGSAELIDVSWIPTNGWVEPKSSFAGVVFGVSCGNDNLLVRGKLGGMTSLRLPHSGFCGFFGIGECITASGRLQGAMPGLAKVTDVTGNQNSCFEAAIVGKIIARSTTHRFLIMETVEGDFIRLGFETEAQAGKLMIGDNARIAGRFQPSSPDVLKVETVSKFMGPTPYETTGRIVQVARNSVTISEKSGRLMVVGLPQGYTEGAGLETRYVQVKGQFENGMFVAKSVVVAKNPEMAIEIEGTIVKTFDHTALVKDFQGGLWQVEIVEHQAYKVGDSVFVAGWSDSTGWWKIRGAAIMATSGEVASTSAMIWGAVSSMDCQANTITITGDDGSKFVAYPSDLGICDSVTVGERVQVSGIIQPGMANTINGAKIARPGLAGDKKMISGVIIEISCVSRIAKLRENDHDGIPGLTWTLQLDKSVKCEDFRVGDEVKAVGDLVLTAKLTLADSIIEKRGSSIVKVEITGQIINLDCAASVMIIKSEGRMFKISTDFSNCLMTYGTGDTVKVSGTSDVGRKTAIKATAIEKIPGKEVYEVLKARVVNTGCKEMRVLVLGGNEFWTVNFLDEETCGKVTDGMVLTFMGKRDPSRTHLLLKAVILDRMLPKVVVGTIDEIYCDQGRVSLQVDGGPSLMVNFETPVGECLSSQYAKGDKIQASGFQDILFPLSDVHFARIERFGNQLGLIPMDFVCEALDVSECRGKGVIQARVGHIVWRIATPEGFDCTSVKSGDWISAKGGRQDFNQKFMVATSIENAKPEIFGFINETNYSTRELHVNEIFKTYRWKVTLANQDDTRMWQKGQYVVVSGDLAGNMRISGARLQRLNMAKGKITLVDPATQSVEIDGEDFKNYKIFTRPEWIDLSQFHTGDMITSLGRLEGDEAKKDKQNIMTWAFIEESSGLPPPPFVVKPCGIHVGKPIVDIIEPKVR